MTRRDFVDGLVAQWERERPDLTPTPMGVFGRISRIARHIEAALLALDQKHGLGEGEFDVLAALRRAGAPHTLTPTDLYRSLMLSSGAMTARLKRLERSGLIARGANPADGRSVQVTLTPRGKRVVDALVGPHLEVERDCLKALSPDDQRMLTRLLRTVALALEETEA